MKVTTETTVYVASAWWTDNDPFTSCIALDAETCEKELDASIDEMAEVWVDQVFNSEGAELNMDPEEWEALSESEQEEQAKNYVDSNIRWSGVSTFTLGDLLDGRELEVAIAELEDFGYYFPDLPY